MILGIGSILYSDDGFGIRVIEQIERDYEFPDEVLVVDGGVLGINLLGVISKPNHLVVVDAIRNRGNPGDLYRLVFRDNGQGLSGEQRARIFQTFHSFFDGGPGLGMAIGNRPLLLLAIMLVFVGVQFITMGLLAELQTRIYHESKKRPTYMVRETLGL